MEVVWWILFGIVMAALIFYVGPVVVSFFVTFGRHKTQDLSKMPLKGTQYEPYRQLLRRDIAYVRRLPQETVSIRSADGLKLVGQYVKRGTNRTALLVHGYHTNALNNFAVIGRILYDVFGFNLLLVDQRSGGRSEGKLVTFGLKERYDVQRWIRFLDKKEEVRHILVVGMSMGATSVAFTADKLRSQKVRGLILDCGFESPEHQIIQRGKEFHFPVSIMLPATRLLVKLLIREDLGDNVILSLRKASVPALFIHGTEDKTVPFYEAENMYREYAGPKSKLFVEGADHAVAFYQDMGHSTAVLRAFLKEAFKQSSEE